MRFQELRLLHEERHLVTDHLDRYRHLHDQARRKTRRLARRMSKEKAAKLSTVDYFARQLRKAEFTRAWIDRRLSSPS
jgi:hypothetical protein